jgi:flavin reductase (DIM6/NTAB) family NADH-FMN oxidoreductase RutF
MCVYKKEIPPEEAYRFFTPGCVVLVGSQKDGRPNVMAASWQMPVSRKPPLVAVAVAKKHLTAEYVQASGAFTLNVPGYGLIERVHFCGTVSGREVDKFSAAGLTPVAGRKVAAPLVAECLAGVECRLWSTYEGGDHWIFVGEVVAAEATPECFEGRWTFRAKELFPVHHLGGTAYAVAGFLAELKRQGDGWTVVEKAVPEGGRF